MNLIFNFITQSLPFLPLALGIYISFNLLKATDMTLDGSFVAGAGTFAKIISLGFSPLLATLCALMAGICTGTMVACMQRQQKIDPLLAGVLASFILVSANLAFMGRPNINLLNQTTLFSHAFNKSELQGYLLVGLSVALICGTALMVLRSPIGLQLRAFGDNPKLFARYGFAVERYRILGFAFTNCLAASAGCLTAQTVNYADIGMGFGVTLTGLGAVIVGQQLILHTFKKQYLRVGLEFSACLLGVLLYFALMNCLLRIGVDPLYLKIVLGILLVFFLRTAARFNKKKG
jgi:putative ABC transport system permease protein